MTKLRLSIAATCSLSSLLGGWAVPAAAAGKPAAAVVHPVNVLAAPTKTVATSSGRVGYREVGTGSPLLLIMGLGGSMNDWTPGFVDALAASHEVVVFDNAGVGETGKLPAPLTVSEMANETSALISALHLGKPAVLGWSMGGMIAQALAVLHPGQVSKLVLAATQEGTGKAVPIPPAAAAKATSANPAAVLSVLFPPTASAALKAYVQAILSYANIDVPSRATVAEQAVAVVQWLVGGDAAGREPGKIEAPTLVADGTVDALDPVANARLLAGSIRRAKVALYPGAGHAFWSQDQASFVPTVERFLS